MPESLQGRALARAVSGEFLAMFLFVFVCVGCALTTGGAGAPVEGAGFTLTAAPLTVSLAFGLTIFVLAHCFGHISGAHVNPAVTVALMVAKQVHPMQGGLYIVAQMAGSIVSSGVLMGTMGLKAETMGGFNAMSGPDDNKVPRAFITEMVLTFLLCFTVFATIDPSRGDGHSSGPLAIGMAVGVAHLIATPITGCGINPARSLGPAIFADNDTAKEDLWVFMVAPFVGAVIAAGLYPFWFAEENFAGGLKDKYRQSASMVHPAKGEAEGS